MAGRNADVTAREWYRTYRIMPSLAAHQMRVAAVVCAILDAREARGHGGTASWRHEIVSACLLHDMGNIIKFDLAYFPEFVEPEGMAYWASVKQEFMAKYGTDEHAATLAIAKEIGVSATTFHNIEGVGFSHAAQTLEEGDLGAILCCYADQRVAPHGIVTLDARFHEGTARYGGRAHRMVDPAYAAREMAALRTMESRLFADAALAPGEVDDARCEKYFSMLEAFVPS